LVVPWRATVQWPDEEILPLPTAFRLRLIKVYAFQDEGRPVKKPAGLLIAIGLACGQAAVADEFQGLQCGADIAKAMIGKRTVNAPIVEIEKKYRAIGLKNLGGDEISGNLSSVSSMICGAEYIELIDRKGFVRDALAFPPHSKAQPAFSGFCQVNGKDLTDVIVGVLDGSVAGDLLPIKTGWKIDQKQSKFVAMPGDGMLCPRSSIYTVDGGK
jgi:hypothetical protein